MTTTPVMSITDEQIADLERRMDTAEQGYGESAYISNETCRALISRIRAAEKDAERYRALQKVTPYRFKKIQDACITDGGDVFYFHADRFDAFIDAAMEQSK